MKVSRRNVSFLLSLLLILFSITVTARADDDEPDDYDVKARVVRISLIDGEVNLKRIGNQDWERTRLNYPLVEGDTLATGKDSRLEIQIDARNFVRLTSNTILRIVTLRDEGIAMSVVEGTAIVRLAKFDRDSRVLRNRRTENNPRRREDRALPHRRAARRPCSSDCARRRPRANLFRHVRLYTPRQSSAQSWLISGDTAGDWELRAAAALDGIDNWVNDRERYLAQRMRHNEKYYDEYVWGAEDLDAYGDWSYADEFGWIWRPHSTALASYSRLGAVSLRALDVVSALRLDVGRLRTVGLGSVSLRPLGLSQQLLGLGAA